MLNFFRKRAIKKQVEYLKEPRPLPLGRKEFDAWSKEIIRLAEIPGLTVESGQFALSDMVLHVKPTQSYESYGYFVHSLRKVAANQVAHAFLQEIKTQHKKRAEEEKQKEVQPTMDTDAKESSKEMRCRESAQAST